MKKLLIIGASILQLPAIKKAKEMGYYVGVVDYNKDAIGISYADEYFNVSTIDIDGVTAVAKHFLPDGIMTLATDMPMRAIAKACEACNLPGISFDTAIKSTDKGEMIKAFEKEGVKHPWYYIVSNKKEFELLMDKVSFPCIMKPTDNAGSRGVVLCNNQEDLKRQYDYSFKESRSGSIIIEQYLQGPEFSVEVMSINGTPYILQITDKLTTGAPHFVEMGHSQPTMQPDEIKKQISDLAYRAVKAVGIEIGPAHVEMILTDDGPIMVELGARMGGDCITTHLVPLSTGIDMIKATIEISCGIIPDIKPRISKGAAIRYFSSSKGVISSIEGYKAARNMHGIQEITFVHNVGEFVGDINSSVDRVGFIIAQDENASLAIQDCDEAMKSIKFTTVDS